jgi:Flp pilus assembly protein TadD
VDAPEATPAQLQSLADEIHALRAELARSTEAEQSAGAAAEETSRERDVLRTKREDFLNQLSGQRQRRRELETELSAVRDQLADAEARMQAATASELNPDRLDQLARAAASIAVREPASADDLFVVERLHSAVPEDPRVSQSLGLLLSRLGRHEAARDALSALSRDQLSRSASLALLRSSLAVGSVPDDIGDLVASIRPSARTFGELRR